MDRRLAGFVALLATALSGAAACGGNGGAPRPDAARVADAGGLAGDDAAAAGDARSADRPAEATPPDAPPRDGGAPAPPPDARGEVAEPSPDAAAADAAPAVACQAAGPCNPFVTTGSGCPEGQLCVADGMTNRAACLTTTTMTAMLKREGETCRSASDCAAGLLCVAGGAPAPTCVRMCPLGSRRFCGENERCFGTLSGHSCIQLCRPVPRACDAHLQNCPDPADTCTLAADPETGEGYTGCRPAGPRQEGEGCDGAANTCARGLVCVRTAGVASCVRVCKSDGAPACTPGKSCTGSLPSYRLMFCQ